MQKLASNFKKNIAFKLFLENNIAATVDSTCILH